MVQRKDALLLTRFRLGLTKLKDQQFSIGRAETPECLCMCPHEDSKHYLLECFLYQEERRRLFESIDETIPSAKFITLSQSKKIDILLYGYKPSNKDYYFLNKKLQVAVQKFIVSTKRFDPSFI